MVEWWFRPVPVVLSNHNCLELDKTAGFEVSSSQFTELKGSYPLRLVSMFSAMTTASKLDRTIGFGYEVASPVGKILL